jgi:outer membrane protein TolC
MVERVRRCAAVLTLVVLAAPPTLAWSQPAPGGPPSAPAPPPIPPVPPVPEAAPGQPLTLAAAVSTALQQNLQVRTAAVQVALARAQLRQAEAGFQPTVGLQGSYTTQSSSGGSILSGTLTVPGAGIVGQPFVAQVPSLGAAPSWLVRLNVAYPLYTGHALEDQLAIARASVRSAEAAFAAVANQVVLSVRQAYYGLELAQGTVGAAQRAVDAAQENVRVTAARVRVGTSPRFDLLQAQVQLAQSQQNLTRAKTGLVQAQQTLALVLNQPLTTRYQPVTPLGLPAPPPNVDALVRMALQQRPELIQARANVEAAEAAIDLAAAGRRPNITLTGGPTVATSDPTERLPVSWTGAIQVTLAILDGGLTDAKVEAARQQLAQAQLAEQQLRQTIEQQVRTAYLGLQDAAEELRSARAALESAREALRIANVRFQAGVGTQLEVVTAEQNLASADVGTVQALYAYNLALAQLDQAVGVQVKF